MYIIDIIFAEIVIILEFVYLLRYKSETWKLIQLFEI